MSPQKLKALKGNRKYRFLIFFVLSNRSVKRLLCFASLNRCFGLADKVINIFKHLCVFPSYKLLSEVKKYQRQCMSHGSKEYFMFLN